MTWSTGLPGNISAIARAKRGSVTSAETRRRRRMSISSSLSPSSSSDTVSGSSAMPQNGHAPGPTCLTSGCIGQV